MAEQGRLGHGPAVPAALPCLAGHSQWKGWGWDRPGLIPKPLPQSRAWGLECMVLASSCITFLSTQSTLQPPSPFISPSHPVRYHYGHGALEAQEVEPHAQVPWQVNGQ